MARRDSGDRTNGQLFAGAREIIQAARLHSSPLRLQASRNCRVMEPACESIAYLPPCYIKLLTSITIKPLVVGIQQPGKLE